MPRSSWLRRVTRPLVLLVKDRGHCQGSFAQRLKDCFTDPGEEQTVFGCRKDFENSLCLSDERVKVCHALLVILTSDSLPQQNIRQLHLLAFKRVR